MKQYRYIDQNGNFDYEAYKKTQIRGNKLKIDLQWVTEESIAYLSKYLKTNLSVLSSGLCHGTRRGLEQGVFSHLLGCQVIGTEISDTASSFPNTIQWDFHEVKEEWLNHFDFIYSNSWDHSYDPMKLFCAWMSCIRVGGLCLLEHTVYHTYVDALDPLGMEEQEMVEFLKELGRPNGASKRY